MKILVTGDREWTDHVTLFNVISSLALLEAHCGNRLTVIHGDYRGADHLADDVAYLVGANRKRYPAKWLVYGYAAGPIRNQQMIDENDDIVLAVGFHNDIHKSGGTKDMLRRCLKHNIPALLYTNDKVFIVTEDLLA